MSLCKDCIVVVHHEGTPEGKIEEIGGVRCYIGTPTKEYAKDKVLLFLPDVFGIDLINAKLVVDDFARCGYKTVAIDYLLEDPITDETFKSSNFSFMDWRNRHTDEKTRARIDPVIAALKEQGVIRFAATGYCFGARYAFDLAFENIISVTIVSHPSLLNIPHDLYRYKEESEAPLLINSCETDPQFPRNHQGTADDILGGGSQFTENYQREYFAGCNHGFAVRGNLSNPAIKAGKEGAFKATVAFLHKHL